MDAQRAAVELAMAINSTGCLKVTKASIPEGAIQLRLSCADVARWEATRQHLWDLQKGYQLLVCERYQRDRREIEQKFWYIEVRAEDRVKAAKAFEKHFIRANTRAQKSPRKPRKVPAAGVADPDSPKDLERTISPVNTYTRETQGGVSTETEVMLAWPMRDPTAKNKDSRGAQTL